MKFPHIQVFAAALYTGNSRPPEINPTAD